ncbi:hypothetical protein [Thermovibrio ammonificans]|jgi:hypothetical protein
MALSINQDIKAGSSVYHLQTEYYQSSGKIVTNIFKDGAAVKRLEKSVPSDLTEEEIDKELRDFHNSIVARLTGGGKKVETKRAGFKLTDEAVERILPILAPYFGIATSFIVEETAAESHSLEEFIDKLVDGLEESEAEFVRGELKQALSEFATGFKLTPELEDKIVSILGEVFGIMAYPVFEDSLSEWREKGGSSFEELVEVILSHAHDDEERRVLREKLSSLEA